MQQTFAADDGAIIVCLSRMVAAIYRFDYSTQGTFTQFYDDFPFALEIIRAMEGDRLSD